MNLEMAQRIWDWLPARTDSRRVTLPSTIGMSLDLDARLVSETLATMEARGHAVRDQATGRQSGWHRGTPLTVAAIRPELPGQGSLLDLLDGDAS